MISAGRRPGWTAIFTPGDAAKYNFHVKRLAVVAVLCLALSSCTWQEINDYSLFKYSGNDDWGDATLKTLGNFLPWTGEALVAATGFSLYLSFYLAILYVQAQR